MTKARRSAIIISASSDIGYALARRWLSYGWMVSGTYRSQSEQVDDLGRLGAKLVYCDLADAQSIGHACASLREVAGEWHVLVVCAGLQEPVGPFVKGDFDGWEESVRVNFISQMRVVHDLLPFRCTSSTADPCVLLFAGGGTNNATVNYSAYTVSKIALIKMCELLDAEVHDTRFAIVGPGWVKTKIHEATLRAGHFAGANYQRTIDKLIGDECIPMDQVLNCLDWLIDAPRHAVSGRNFSVVFDKWGNPELETRLASDHDMYKLRRHGNDW